MTSETWKRLAVLADLFAGDLTSLVGLGRIGWHTFRHTFRTLLDETGAPMKVQQELMRNADIRTTMNVYGKAMEKRGTPTAKS
jgi:integrase